jgi:hypothetical protein
VDRHRRERVGRLEDHADQASHLHGVDPLRVDVLAVELDRALDAGAGRKVVLPQPEEPIRAVTLFGSIFTVTSSTAWKSP